MAAHKTITSQHEHVRASKQSYALGFALSLLLTLVPFAVVVYELVSGLALMLVLMVLALAQLIVQLKFFIHLGHERSPRWNRISFVFMVLVVFILVGGSLWIMYNLDYNMRRSGGHSMPEEGF